MSVCHPVGTPRRRVRSILAGAAPIALAAMASVGCGRGPAGNGSATTVAATERPAAVGLAAGGAEARPPSSGAGAAPPASPVLSPTLGITLTDLAVWGALAPDEARSGTTVTVALSRPGRSGASPVGTAGSGAVPSGAAFTAGPATPFASGDTTTAPGEPTWRVFLSDAGGASASVMPGDAVRVTVGARVVDAVVPDVRLAFERADGALRGTIEGIAADRDGRGDGAWHVDVATGGARPARRRARTTVTAGGAEGTARFALALGPGALDGRTPITVTARHAATGLAVAWVRTAPWARVSLHPGDITGALRPRAGVTLTLAAADGSRRGEARGVTDLAGRFSLWARDATGRRLRPVAGDRVTLDDGESTLAVDVPPLSGAWDLDAGTLTGPALPGARLEVVLWNPWRPGEVATPATAADVDGRWRLAGIPLHPATHFYLTELLPGGDQAYYCQQVPMLYVAPGSPAVEVQTLWEIEADVALVRAGRTVARARGGGPWSRNVVLTLRDAAGRPVAVQAGDRLTGTLDGQPVDVGVGRFDARLDAATARITGHAAPGARVGLARDRQVIQAVQATAGADGAFVLDAAEALVDGRPAPGVEVEAFQSVAGHNLRARLVGPSLVATLGGRTATGRATPGAGVTVTRSEGGAGSTVADDAGRWTITWDAAEPALTAGETLTLAVDNDQADASTFILPDLSAAIDVQAGMLRGTGTPDGLVSIQAFVGDDVEPVTLSGFVDGAGRWAVDLRDRGDGTASLDAAQLRRVVVTGVGDAGAGRVVVASASP